MKKAYLIGLTAAIILISQTAAFACGVHDGSGKKDAKKVTETAEEK